MNTMQVIGGFLSIVVYGMLMAAVFKLFAISSDLSEIKELLKKRNEAERPLPWAGGVADTVPGNKWSVLDNDE